MKCLLIVYSYHHNNTQRVAEVISKVINAQVKSPQKAVIEELSQYDLLGFGSGIDSGNNYKELRDFADSLPQVSNKKAFIFSTSAIQGKDKVAKDHSLLREKLQAKGYLIVGEFSCKGFNTNSFLKYFGGLNRGRPNAEDLKDAEKFAQTLREK